MILAVANEGSWVILVCNSFSDSNLVVMERECPLLLKERFSMLYFSRVFLSLAWSVGGRGDCQWSWSRVSCGELGVFSIPVEVLFVEGKNEAAIL